MSFGRTEASSRFGGYEPNYGKRASYSPLREDDRSKEKKNVSFAKNYWTDCIWLTINFIFYYY